MAAAAADDLDVAGDKDLVVVDRCSPTDATLSPCGGIGGDATLSFGGTTFAGALWMTFTGCLLLETKHTYNLK